VYYACVMLCVAQALRFLWYVLVVEWVVVEWVVVDVNDCVSSYGKMCCIDSVRYLRHLICCCFTRPM